MNVSARGADHDAEAIAQAALFLADDDSRMITKQCLTIYAGLR